MFESDITALGNSIAAIVSDCDSAMEGIAATSQRRAAAALSAGDTIPEFGKFEPGDVEGAREMYDTISRAVAQAKDAVSGFEASIRARMATAPDPAEQQAVAFALSKSSVSRQELLALYETYGGNYQLASAISDRAEQMGMALHEPQTIDPGNAEETVAHVIANRYVYPHGSHSLMHPMADASFVATQALRALQHLDAFGKPTRRLHIDENGRMTY